MVAGRSWDGGGMAAGWSWGHRRWSWGHRGIIVGWSWCHRGDGATPGPPTETNDAEPHSPTSPARFVHQSELNDKVVHLLIEAWPEGVCRRVKPDTDDEETKGDEKESYPIDLYIKKLDESDGLSMEDPGYILCLLLGSLPIKDLMKTAGRPKLFPKMEELYDGEDRHAIEMWVGGVLFRDDFQDHDSYSIPSQDMVFPQ